MPTRTRARKKTSGRATKAVARPRKAGTTRKRSPKELLQWLARVPPRPIAARHDLDHVGPAPAARGIGIAASAVAVATGAGALTFVAMVSNDGPWELRSLIVNDFQVLDKTIPATTRRVDVPIPAVFGQQLQLTWSILAGQLIPALATFVQEAGQEPVLLAQKNALKKGESWAPLETVPFPPAQE